MKMVSEVVLLIPLLHRLRHPGADAARLGPVVEEENWSGLESVQFRPFRRNMRLHQDKRRWVNLLPSTAVATGLQLKATFHFHRKVLNLIRTHAPMAKDRPLVLLSWLALLAFEDLPEFSGLTGVPAEHLLQSLLYRLRERGEEPSHSAQETVKVVTPFKIAPFHPPSDSLLRFFSPLTQAILTRVLAGARR